MRAATLAAQQTQAINIEIMAEQNIETSTATAAALQQAQAINHAIMVEQTIDPEAIAAAAEQSLDMYDAAVDQLLANMRNAAAEAAVIVAETVAHDEAAEEYDECG